MSIGALLRSPRDAAVVTRSSIFDATWYRQRYAERIPRWMSPLFHHVTAGRDLDPHPLFDSAWYVSQRPYAGPPATLPLVHYLEEGAHDGLDPSVGFSNWWYLRRYADARASGLTALEHYVRVGQREHRDPAPPPASPRFRGARSFLHPDSWSAEPSPALDGQRLVCLFSHFDPNGRILPYVRHYLRALRACGFTVHVVSSAPSLDEADRSVVEAMNIAVHRRENVGHDFGSWQWGLRHVAGVQDADWLLLANDSMFGPFADLGPMVRAQLAAAPDFWGLTNSYEHAWHIQSYFICIRGAVARGPAFAEVFAQDFSGGAKASIVSNGEIFLSQSLVAAGHRGAIAYPFDALAEVEPTGVCNPTHFAWQELIARHAFPFIKRDLVRDNPEKIANAATWRDVLAHRTRYDGALIEDYLRAISAGARR